MNSVTIILLIIAIIAVGVAAWAYFERQKTLKLRSKFGPEYDRLAEREHSPRRAEAILEKRAQRVSKFNIRALGQEESARFAGEWRVIQEHFVDDPRGAVTEADRLINTVLKARGYPMADFEQQAADLSVQYSQVVENYRKAHQIALEDRRGSATTEDLRKAMQYYRSLFEDVLDVRVSRMEEVHHG